MNATSLIRMLSVLGSVELVNPRGFIITAYSVACGDLGVYDAKGTFVSFVTLRVEGFTVIK